jgi:hypothetical protein
MADFLPREVVVTELADGVRYRLPRRHGIWLVDAWDGCVVRGSRWAVVCAQGRMAVQKLGTETAPRGRLRLLDGRRSLWRRRDILYGEP